MLSENLKKELNEINADDRKTLVGTSFVTTLEDKFVEDKLLEYYADYELPVTIGTIFEMDGKTYKVTCVYTDNSVDIIGDDQQKKNIGLYKKTIKVTGSLTLVKEERRF